MTLTKADIDALVDGMRAVLGEEADVIIAAWTNAGNTVRVRRDDLRPELYHSAGLTATGERKPERVRCWLISDEDGRRRYSWFTEPTALDRLNLLNMDCTITPGWFVPDGGE